MDIKKYCCKKCNNIPTDDILKCIENHIFCLTCVGLHSKRCNMCGNRLAPDKNQAFKDLIYNSGKITINDPCTFKNRGCTWTFPSPKEIDAHIKECKYQPYECIGQKLGIWKCAWKSSKHEIEDHLLKAHKNIIIKAYEFQEESSVFFNETLFKNGFKQIRLIRAFNKSFIFLYEIDNKQKLIFIIIFLMGRKQDAAKYMYNFSIISSKDESMKIKFALPCFSDIDDIRQHMENGECVCLPFNVAEQYSDIDNKALSFFFRMSKRETTE
ncbi:E3 ubiquitin-protein ligase Siah2-like [Condylostylus longicornis]|uniref:E3 ubiquitin-protein ligase Siah2-like n=1 Tax=Condylostylus longicornis TaxID=2530218 RepID=UPI00244E49D6|nr:E3 ubiquitin-protein ligase Siah2-like [Condylostylus longicornis]XP_055384640.1 E3 ubiquitin-protein ligase Siah2-like [Condylostylus longicornis]XP_055384641.1 E3 ubiquitin-protein ligase Siah2-like [Condylostylus longicornis]